MNVCGFILIISFSSYYFSARASNTEEILCVYNESCVLPCDFTPGSDLDIRWAQRDRGLIVHSFHHGQNQDVDQDHKYRGRTSLFEEEMNRGNASLLLRDVTVEDKGRYLCRVNDQVTYVDMWVFDEEIVCVYNESCVLPCRFTPGSDLEIRWTKTKEWLIVHSFHHGQNQDVDQDRKYRGRTSLFEEEMNRGKASLLLRDVTLGDKGLYMCWINSNVTYVNMKVFAPVLEVHVDSSGGNLYCHALDIYPEPSLKWTINPELSAEPQTSVNPSETGFFSVHSSVPLPPDPPYEYTCTVSTEHSTKSKTYKRTYEETSVKTTERDVDPLSPFRVAGIVVAVAVAVGAVVCGVLIGRSRRSRKPRADADADVEVPNREEEHLGPNNSEEAETEQ